MNPYSEYLDKISVRLYGRKRSECIPKGMCVSCGKVVGELSQLDAKEFSMSGMCPTCFDQLKEDE